MKKTKPKTSAKSKDLHAFNMKLFASRIKSIRKQLDLNQADVALATNRSRSAYNIIEHGTVAPSLDFFVNLKEFFNKKGVDLSYDYLFGASEHMNEREVAKKLQAKYDLLEKDYKHLKQVSELQEKLIK